MDFQKKKTPSEIISNRGTSKIVYIETNEQQADIMAKSLAKQQFEYLHKYIMGW